MLQWCHDHTGTRSHTGTQLVPKTGNVMDFTLCFPFSNKYCISVYLSGTVLFCIPFVSTLHHDGMVHSNTAEYTMLSSF